jgi:hypothetical protein
MYRSDFFDNEVTTTLTSNESMSFHQNDYVQITVYNRANDTSSPTAPVKVLYRVKAYTTYSANITPVNQAQEDSWFPTRRELNNQAARRGAQAQAKQHARIPKKALVLRSSYQGMARLPCYRATRPR